MLDKDIMICNCNGETIGDIAQNIKDNNIQTLDELLECQKCNVGDKCELCHEDGSEGNGYSLAMVLSLTKQGRL